MSHLTVPATTSPNGAPAGKVPISAEVITITPLMAIQMLAGNIVNRPLRKQRVALYAKQMVNGQWRVTGEAIVLSPTGQLLQGQHRLTACVEADRPFTSVIVRGVDPAAMRVMDTGLARTAADSFSFEGVTYSAAQAATVRQIIGIKGGYATNTSRLALITRDDMLDFYAQHAELLEFARVASTAVYGALRHSRAGWASLAFLLGEVDAELTESFFDGLGSGADMSPGDARLALRAHCLNRTVARRSILWPELVANGIRAWNSWIDDKPVTHIKGWKPASGWPEIKG